MRSTSILRYTPTTGERDDFLLGSSGSGRRCGSFSRVRIPSSIATLPCMVSLSRVSIERTIGHSPRSSRMGCNTGGATSAGMECSASSIRLQSVRWISSMRRICIGRSGLSTSSSAAGHGDVRISSSYCLRSSKTKKSKPPRKSERQYTSSTIISSGRVDHLCSFSSDMYQAYSPRSTTHWRRSQCRSRAHSYSRFYLLRSSSRASSRSTSCDDIPTSRLSTTYGICYSGSQSPSSHSPSSPSLRSSLRYDSFSASGSTPSILLRRWRGRNNL